MMNLAFAGFRHGHIFVLYDMASKSADVNIAGCFEENDVERKNIADVNGIDFNYDSYEAILSDDSVDAVAIGDYYGKRGKMVIDALKSGKHVICDKPLCTSLEELDEIEKLVEHTGLKVSCMLDLRYMPQVETVKRLIEQGTIGRVVNVSFTGQHCLNYGSRPGWYFEDGKHGGTINDISIHGVDLIRYLTGKNLTKVNWARTWNAFADKEPGFKDCGQFAAELEDVALLVDVSYAAPKFCGALPTYWDFYLWGTEGMINFRYSENVVHLYKETEEVISCDVSDMDYLKDFINEINNKPATVDTKETLKTQRQVLTIQKTADC